MNQFNKTGRRTKVSKTKELKLASIILGLAFALSLFISTTKSASAASQTPHGISGYVLYSNGSQVESGMQISVNDTTSNFFRINETSGPTGHNGFYSTNIEGSDNDIVIIKAWNATHYGLRAIKLNQDMQGINITLNVDNNAPALRPVTQDGTLGVWITPTLPANNTDLFCQYSYVTDPNNSKITLNYTWWKNNLLVDKNSMFSAKTETGTSFLAKYDASLNANFSLGNGTADGNNPGIVEGKYGNAVNMTSPSSRLNYTALDNINVSEGTIEFWFKPAWDASNANSFLFYSGVNPNRIWVYFVGTDRTLRVSYGSRTISANASHFKRNNWYHIATTWSLKNDTFYGLTQNMQLYINGELNKEDSAGIASPISFGANFYIGTQGNTNTNYANGTFDDLRISNYEKTKYDIFKSYSTAIIDYKNISSGDSWKCSIKPINEHTTGSNIEGYELETDTINVSNYSVDVSYTDTSGNEKNTTIQAGKPTSLRIIVNKDGNAIQNAEIRIYEKSGFASMSYLQKDQTNASSEQLGTTYTNSLGIAGLTIIPTGGRYDYIPTQYYDLTLDIYIGKDKIYSKSLPVSLGNRRLDRYSGSYKTYSITNLNDYASANKWYGLFLTYYTRVNEFLS